MKYECCFEVQCEFSSASIIQSVSQSAINANAAISNLLKVRPTTGNNKNNKNKQQQQLINNNNEIIYASIRQLKLELELEQSVTDSVSLPALEQLLFSDPSLSHAHLWPLPAPAPCSFSNN